MSGRKYNVLTTAAVLIGADIAIGAGIWLAAVAMASPADAAPACDQTDVTQCRWTVELSGCAYEDGNPDGRPCLWIDPDTGRGYVNDGSNYR